MIRPFKPRLCNLIHRVPLLESINTELPQLQRICKNKQQCRDVTGWDDVDVKTQTG